MSETLLGRLIAHDREVKGSAFERDVTHLMAYYDDCAQQVTRDRLKDLGLGIPDNEKPIQPGMIRRVIDRISVIWANPPMRWLKLDGEKLNDDHPEHQKMVSMLRRSQYDLALRRADHIRSLVGQGVIRCYPLDALGRVSMRVFTPENLMRMPSLHAPDILEEDAAFCLKLDGGFFELWEKTSDGWRMQWVDKQGEPGELQPMAEFDEAGENVNPNFLWPEGEPLPVHVIYDEWTGGRAWVPPRQSRLAWIEATSAIANDLWNLIAFQAHDRAVYTKRDPNHSAPRTTSPSATFEIPEGDEYEILSTNPKIAECQAVLESLNQIWMISEDLPANELDRSKNIVTGASLLVQERALNGRRERQIPLAIEDERALWTKYRSVHNQHAAQWGAEILDPKTEMDAQIADLSVPRDSAELAETYAKKIYMKGASIIDYIQKDQNVSRDQAIAVYHRVMEDQKTFPIFDAALEPEEPTEDVPDTSVDVSDLQSVAAFR